MMKIEKEKKHQNNYGKAKGKQKHIPSVGKTS